VYKIALINMPFAAAEFPSIALTQLRSVLHGELGDEVQCEILYLNLDFVRLLGQPLYELVSNSVDANTAGLGDWFFSQEAFPELPDRSDAYLARHFSGPGGQLDVFKRTLSEKRLTVHAFLEDLIRRYRLDQVSLAGFTSMFSQNIACIALAKALKQRAPGIRVAMGGANCESPMGNVLVRHVPWVDFVFSGPGLRSFPRLVRHLVAGEEAECHRIAGVVTARKLALQVSGGVKEIGEELDIDVDVELDYDDYFAQHDRKLPGVRLQPKIPFETSRGCWWGERSHCTFCGLNGMTMRYRAMAPAKAVRLLQRLFDRYAARSSEFQSVDNILPREYLTDVLPRLHTPDHVSLFYEVKADLKEHEMALLERARVNKIQPGIEALSTTTLKLMRKGTTAFQNIKFLKYCSYHQVKPYWNLLVGFPNEPESVYRKYCDDLPLLVHLEPPTGVYPVRFDRFSPYYMLAKEYGLALRPCDFYGMIYPFPSEELNDFAYFFSDDNFDASYVTNTARWLSKLRERVNHWHQRWHQRDHGLAPQLVWRGAGDDRFIYDSRTGKATEHRPGPAGLRVLDALAEQHRLPRLAEKLPELPATEIERQVTQLRRQALLFEEDGLYMSLVLEPVSQPEALPARPAAAMERLAANA
jgi:ribosomal peptide maturation radical SAM protein 1